MVFLVDFTIVFIVTMGQNRDYTDALGRKRAYLSGGDRFATYIDLATLETTTR